MRCALTREVVQGWGYSVQALDAFLLTLFKEYAELLKKRFGDDFQEVNRAWLLRGHMAALG